MQPHWFLALPVPAEHWFAERVVAHPMPQVRLFAAEDLHLTVAFLGAVSESAARAAWAERMAWESPLARVTLGSVIGMGPPAHFSALSALLEEGRETVERGMRQCRDRMLAAAEVAREERPIKAHVTLGRPLRSATLAQRSAALAWAMHLPLRGVEVRLSEMALYSGAEDRSVRQFQIHARAPLTV